VLSPKRVVDVDVHAECVFHARRVEFRARPGGEQRARTNEPTRRTRDAHARRARAVLDQSCELPCQVRDGVFQVTSMVGSQLDCHTRYLFNNERTLFACLEDFHG
jgi:hypothetical protein